MKQRLMIVSWFMLLPATSGANCGKAANKDIEVAQRVYESADWPTQVNLVIASIEPGTKRMKIGPRLHSLSVFNLGETDRGTFPIADQAGKNIQISLDGSEKIGAGQDQIRNGEIQFYSRHLDLTFDGKSVELNARMYSKFSPLLQQAAIASDGLSPAIQNLLGDSQTESSLYVASFRTAQKEKLRGWVIIQGEINIKGMAPQPTHFVRWVPFGANG